MDIIKNRISNRQTDILNRYVLGITNVTLMLLLIYNIFSKQYLPNSGTAVIMAIISALAIIYVSVNMFIDGLNMYDVKNMINAVTMQNISTERELNKARKEYSIFKMINSAKMFYISIITTALSVLFFKYNDIILNHHSTIPYFDTFFLLVIFSIMAQTVYTTSIHFTYTKEIIEKYLKVSYRSLMTFGILNFINLLFIVSMFTELQFMPTDG